MPMDEVGQQRYSMPSLDGSYAAAIYTQRNEQRQMGSRPHWNIHLTVDDNPRDSGRVSKSQREAAHGTVRRIRVGPHGRGR